MCLNFPALDFVKPSSGFHPVTWERVSTSPSTYSEPTQGLHKGSIGQETALNTETNVWTTSHDRLPQRQRVGEGLGQAKAYQGMAIFSPKSTANTPYPRAPLGQTKSNHLNKGARVLARKGLLEPGNFDGYLPTHKCQNRHSGGQNDGPTHQNGRNPRRGKGLAHYPPPTRQFRVSHNQHLRPKDVQG